MTLRWSSEPGVTGPSPASTSCETSASCESSLTPRICRFSAIGCIDETGTEFERRLRYSTRLRRSQFTACEANAAQAAIALQRDSHQARTSRWP